MISCLISGNHRTQPAAHAKNLCLNFAITPGCSRSVMGLAKKRTESLRAALRNEYDLRALDLCVCRLAYNGCPSRTKQICAFSLEAFCCSKDTILITSLTSSPMTVCKVVYVYESCFAIAPGSSR